MFLRKIKLKNRILINYITFAMLCSLRTQHLKIIKKIKYTQEAI